MIDAHIHLEQGEYTLEWLNEFVKTAIERNIDEIWVLEHTHRFVEFMPIYQQVKEVNDLQKAWIEKKKLHALSEYLDFVAEMKKRDFPVKIKFGLEVCYFPQHEKFIKDLLDQCSLDFVVGSIHFIDNMAYDLKGISEQTLWDVYPIDWIWQRYFELMKQCIQSGLFDGIAHPDTLKMFHRMPSFDLTPYWENLADQLNEARMYTENNVGCHYRYGHEDVGLNPKVFQIFKDKKVKLYYATDSHHPKYVGIHLAELD